MHRAHPEGLYQTQIPRPTDSIDYEYLVQEEGRAPYRCSDPYRFRGVRFSGEDQRLFVRGEHLRLFEKLGFQHEHEAKAFLQDLQERLRKFELGLHPDKTRPIRFGRHAARECKARGEGKPETFDFLGFTHFCTRSKKTGGFVIGRKTIKKRMVAKLRALKVELRKRMHDSIAEANAAKASVSR